MNAFWSGTDDTNERGRKLRMYSVYGLITNETPAHEIRIGFLGDFYKIQLDFIFDLPQFRTYTEISSETTTRDSVWLPTITKTTKEVLEVDMPDNLTELVSGDGVTYTNVVAPKMYKTVPKPTESRYPDTWWEEFIKPNAFRQYVNTHNSTKLVEETEADAIGGVTKDTTYDVDLTNFTTEDVDLDAGYYRGLATGNAESDAIVYSTEQVELEKEANDVVVTEETDIVIEPEGTPSTNVSDVLDSVYKENEQPPKQTPPSEKLKPKSKHSFGISKTKGTNGFGL